MLEIEFLHDQMVLQLSWPKCKIADICSYVTLSMSKLLTAEPAIPPARSSLEI